MSDELDNWDAFGGTFLKASDVQGEDDAYVCINVSVTETQKGKKKVRLSLERFNIKKDFDLNIVNQTRLKSLGITSPKALIGYKIYFSKVMANNPITKTEVPSLRISKIEKA